MNEQERYIHELESIIVLMLSWIASEQAIFKGDLGRIGTLVQDATQSWGLILNSLNKKMQGSNAAFSVLPALNLDSAIPTDNLTALLIKAVTTANAINQDIDLGIQSLQVEDIVSQIINYLQNDLHKRKILFEKIQENFEITNSTLTSKMQNLQTIREKLIQLESDRASHPVGQSNLDDGIIEIF